MPNLELRRKDDVSSFRKIAIGTWRDAYDPQVYGTLELRMENALAYLAAFREKTGKHLTVSHMLAKAVAMALVKCPDANAVLRFNRIYLRQNIGVFFQVVMDDLGEDKIDLSGATVYEVDKKSLVQICDEFQAKVDTVRKRQDPALEKTRRSFDSIPYLLLNFVTRFLSILSIGLNLDLRRLGIPSDPFGSVMITNIGSIGLDQAFVPLVPYARVPILLALGAVREQPVVENGQVVVGKVMKVNATFDHRFIDGLHAAIMSKVLHEHMDRPEEFFGPV